MSLIAYDWLDVCMLQFTYFIIDSNEDISDDAVVVLMLSF
jgi:hypothetical protein